MEAVDFAAALEKSKKFCAYQERAISDVRRYLQRFQLSETEQQTIVETLIEQDFVDEQRFVEAFVRGKMNAKQWGKRKILHHLKQKGIAESAINRQLAAVEEQKYQDNLDDVIAKWQRANVLTQSTLSKLYRYLLGKGYEYEEIVQRVQNLKKDI